MIVSIEKIDSLYKKLKEAEVKIYSDIKDESWGRTFSILDIDRKII